MFRPKFTITNKILNNIAQIEAAREVILAAPLIPRYEVRFKEDALLHSVHHGTHIEGNPLGEETVREVLKSPPSLRKRDRNVQEVINLRKVLRFIDEWGIKERKLAASQARRGVLYTEDLIKHIHTLVVDRIVPEGQAGAYRKVSVVTRSSRTGEVSFRAPPVSGVSSQMHDFVEWLSLKEVMELHPVLKAAIIHYELARIHPFVEGNGRTARAMATLVLFNEGYDIKKFFSLERYFDQDADRYFGTLQEVSNQLVADENERDLTYWLEYFSEALASEFNRVKGKARRLSLDLKLKGKLGEQIELSERQVKLIEFIEKHGKLRNPDFKNILPMVSEDTILRDLKDLMKKKLVKKKGKTKAASYELRQ
jgi:Fic family protein